ncbi:hypothetical protein GCM10027275_52390 [Rhabdobacter roseus]|uniref:Outer membrane protein TolC n=1 Tax=Rhabdobacter roseus TaxID=1655419 RepID=A0A840TVP2_9BACT|nr:TolC family protein [Rhabdobacter roseus]MBB5287314.1 outer membrane protein TolC [Rhabdobacter roseus]
MKKWLVVLVLAPLALGVLGQAAPKPPTTEQQIVLPPLNKVVEMVLQRSPDLRYQEALIKRDENNIENKKRQWMEGMGIDLQLSAGNQALLIQQPIGTVDAYRNLNNGYRAAFNVRLSAFDFLGRRSTVRMAEYERLMSTEKKGSVEQEIETAVATRYYAAQASINLLQIKSEVKQSTQLNRQMADKAFTQGTITIEELTRVVEISGRAAAEYEVAKQYLYENLRALEIMTGQKLY